MYITYKIICKITNKFYIGSHKTDDPNDDYMGSGKLVKESVLKYGEENHCKEILGIFETRKESTDLEHKLIKEMKKNQPNNCLNISFGGESFDYINTNLKFNRAAFGRMASHVYNTEQREKNIDNYNISPKHCLECGKVISYDKRYNKFCSSHCSVTYNNRFCSRHRAEEGFCKYCGKAFLIKRKSKQLFCCIRCASLFANAHKDPTKIQEQLLKDIEVIKKRHTTESYRQIAKTYNISGNYLRCFLRKNNRTCIDKPVNHD